MEGSSMKVRNGTNKKRNDPEPRIVQEPPLVVNCICCNCDAVFSPFKVAGSYLERKCPSCGKALTEDDYDAAAAAIITEIDALRSQREELRDEAKKWDVWAFRFRFAVFFPLRRFFQKRAKAARDGKAKLKRHIKAKQNRLNALAKSRYYTEEWFQRTHTPLQRTVVDPYTINLPALFL